MSKDTCNYPDCNCPFDAPADPNWCARGLPKQAAKPADALGSLPVVEGIAADDWIDGAWDDTHGSGLFATSDAIRQFADHAQATAEIAKRDARIERLQSDLSKEKHNCAVAERLLGDKYEELTTLRAKLAGVDGLVEALRKNARAFRHKENGHIAYVITDRTLLDDYEDVLILPDLTNDKIDAALATYEAAQK